MAVEAIEAWFVCGLANTEPYPEEALQVHDRAPKASVMAMGLKEGIMVDMVIECALENCKWSSKRGSWDNVLLVQVSIPGGFKVLGMDRDGLATFTGGSERGEKSYGVPLV